MMFLSKISFFCFRYFYITFLRDPVHRYLSEFRHVRRGATWKTARLLCQGRPATRVSLRVLAVKLGLSKLTKLCTSVCVCLTFRVRVFLVFVSVGSGVGIVVSCICFIIHCLFLPFSFSISFLLSIFLHPWHALHHADSLSLFYSLFYRSHLFLFPPSLSCNHSSNNHKYYFFKMNCL